VIEIREASAAEISTARAIFAEYMESIRHLAACSFEHQKTDHELATLPGRYGAPSGAIFLAWDNDACIGCAALRALPLQGACELKRMYVRPSHRGLGLGRKLCDRVLEKARLIGYSRMLLDSDPELAAAISLYRTIGFTDVPRYNEDPDPHTIYMGIQL
jgi:putative acetyltransferase